MGHNATSEYVFHIGANQVAADDLMTGLQALRQGDARGARECFARCIQAGQANSAVLLGLARASLQLEDYAAGHAALDQLLASDPRNPSALILKADHFDRTGDTRSAASFYTMALKSAPPREKLSMEFVGELRRAQETIVRYASDYQSFMLESLKQKGFDPTTSSRRFSKSLDIVLGRKQIYLQQPRYYYFPGLPQIEFYDRADFPWFDKVEQATADIREELVAVMKDPAAFSPYVQGDANRPRKDQAGMLNNPAWSSFFLWKNGEVVAENAARCPKTMAALKDVPLARVPNRSPSILFSLLKPGAHIPPHNGLINARLICRLPIIVPPKCRFRVGSEEREWIEGKGWLFDDTIEHEAWNDSDQTRVILLFDVWRPEVTEEERALIVALFEAIDKHSGVKPDWEI